MKEKVIKVNGKKICYQIKKKEVKKCKTLRPAIIFIHGATSSLSALKWLIEPFKNEDFSLILVDLGGHGFSFRTSNFKDLLIENQVNYIREILVKENIKKVILVGHCLGSMVAATFAALEKEKVIKLILISPGFGLPLRLYFLRKNDLFKRVIDFFSKTSSSKGIFDASTSLKRSFDTELRTKCNPESCRRVDKRLNYQRYLNTGDFYLPRIISDLKHMSFKTAFSQLRAVFEWRGEKYFKMINVPTLIIAGKRDKIFPPEEALGIKNLIRGAKIKLFAEADHVPVLNIPEKLALEVFNFLKES